MGKRLLSVLMCGIFFGLAADEVKITIVTDRPEAIYRCGEPAVFVIDSDRPGAGELPYLIREYNRPVSEGTIRLDRLPTEIKATLEKPGFLTCTVGKGKGAVSYGAGFEPENIRLAVDNEAADFDRFWREARQQQEKSGPISMEKLPAYSNDRHTAYLLTVPTVDGNRIYGFLSEPAEPGRYPLLASVHGAGAGFHAPDITYADRGVVTLQMCIHSYPPAIGDREATLKRYREAYNRYSGLRDQVDDRQRHIYYRSYLGVSRAIDFAAARPNVDAGRVVISGSSQGGTFAIAMAALNPRVTAAAALVPGFADHHGLLEKTGNSHLFAPGLEDREKIADIRITVAYFDTAYFARRLKVPVFFAVGFVDRTCTPHSIYAAYNLITAPREMAHFPGAGHANPPEMRRQRDRWVERQLGL